jgi:hypothetical protein
MERWGLKSYFSWKTGKTGINFENRCKNCEFFGQILILVTLLLQLSEEIGIFYDTLIRHQKFYKKA